MSGFSSALGEASQAGDEDTIVHPSPLHGDGVLAAVPVAAKGQLLFEEAPLLFIQSLRNRNNNLICPGCQSFVGSLSMQLDVLCGTISRRDQEDLDAHSSSSMVPGHVGTGLGTFPGNKKMSSVVLCGQKCGEVYCSDACRALHWSKGHCLLCTGHAEQEDPIVEFKVHAIESNEIFLMVADVFAAVCVHAERKAREGFAPADAAAELIQSTFGSYVHELWWDAAVAPAGTDSQKLRDTLQVLVKESYALLSVALQIEQRQLHDVLSEEFMSRTIGMFEQNNVSVNLVNPLQTFVTSLQPGQAAVAHFASATQMIADSLEEEEEEEAEEDGEDWESMDEEEGEEGEEGEEENDGENDGDMYCMDVGAFPANSNIPIPATIKRATTDVAFDTLTSVLQHNGPENIFPPLDGAAFYLKICKINHSCEPNVRIQTAAHAAGCGLGLRAQAISLRPIAAGEELTQSYIDQNLPFEKRQQALKDYGFMCTCSKCREQR